MNNQFIPSMQILLGDVVVGRSGGIGGGNGGGEIAEIVTIDGVDYYLIDGTWYDEDGNPHGSGSMPTP